jgi:predicted dehydrogenase
MDINQEVLSRIGKKYRYKITTEINDIINSEIDTAFVVLPNHLHFEFVKKLLENEKNVYIEKPLVNSSAEAKELYAIANKNNVVLYTCHNLAYENYMLKIKEFIQNGTMGDIYDIDIERSLPTAFSMKENDWRNSSTSCPFGPLMQLGIHFIDFFNDIFGEFNIVYSNISSNVVKNDDLYYGLIGYGSVRCRLKFSYVSSNLFKIFINAQNFNLIYDGSELVKVFHNGKREKVLLEESDSLELSVAVFLELIKEKNIESNTKRAIYSIESIERLGKYAREI